MENFLNKILLEVRRYFIYIPDHIIHPDYFDHWQSHVESVENQEVFVGDCDDHALTVAELLYKRNIEPSFLKLIFCKTETDEFHLVTSCKHWILDNRQRKVFYWKKLKYQWISSMRLNEKGIWRSMT